MIPTRLTAGRGTVPVCVCVCVCVCVLRVCAPDRRHGEGQGKVSPMIWRRQSDLINQWNCPEACACVVRACVHASARATDCLAVKGSERKSPPMIWIHQPESTGNRWNRKRVCVRACACACVSGACATRRRFGEWAESGHRRSRVPRFTAKRAWN
jgi:hypothetical protein